MIAGRLGLLLLAAGCVAPPPLPDGRPDRFSKAEEAYLRGDVASALVEFERFRRTFPNSPFISRAFYFEGLCLLTDGKPFGARERLEKALKESRDPAERAQIQMATGDSYFLQDQYREAEKAYLAARGTGGVPTDEVLYKAALCARRMGKWDVAEDGFRQVVQDYPTGRRAVQAERNLAGQEKFFSIQAGTFRVKGNADRTADAMRTAGLEARLQEVSSPSGPLYRVFVGKFSDYLLAKREMADLKIKGVISDARIVP